LTGESARLAKVLVVVLVWSIVLGYARLVAAKEKAGPDRPWFAAFSGLGWLRATTPRGQRHVELFITVLFLGPALFILFLLMGWF
jgi:hypothetical protein